MHNLPNEEILEKLAKILRLANNNAATPHEAEAAMARAKELAMKHQIDIAMVSLADPNEKKTYGVEIVKEDVKIRSQKFQLYHKYIWWTLQDVFGVRVIFFGRSRFCFVGDATDVLICKELFPWLEDVFYSTYYKARKAGIVEMTAACKRGIYAGLHRGIAAANKREEEKLNPKEAQCFALVVRTKDALIAKEMEGVKEAKHREVGIDGGAYAHGKKEGSKIKLGQVGNSAQAAQLK